MLGVAVEVVRPESISYSQKKKNTFKQKGHYSFFLGILYVLAYDKKKGINNMILSGNVLNILIYFAY